MSIVKINNLDKVEKLFAELSKKEEKVLAKSNLQFMKNVKRSAKQMAPRDTGELADSINIKSTKTKGKTQQYLLEVTAPYASFQEYGFKPHPFLVDPGRPGFKTNKLKHLYGKVIWVKKNKPFIRPAIEKNFSKFSQSLNKGIREAITA